MVLRAVGPSLVDAGVTDALSNPVLELNDSRESAIVATLSPGNYTAVVHDAASAQGVALVEVYNMEN